MQGPVSSACFPRTQCSLTYRSGLAVLTLSVAVHHRQSIVPIRCPACFREKPPRRLVATNRRSSPAPIFLRTRSYVALDRVQPGGVAYLTTQPYGLKKVHRSGLPEP